MRIGVISVENGKILVSFKGIIGVDVKKDEKPVEILGQKYGSKTVEYLGTINEQDIYLAKPFNARGEWVGPEDSRLDNIRTKILPHLQWIGLI